MPFLRAYTPADFPLLNSWVTSRELLLLYAGTHFSYPLTEEQMITYQKEYTDRKMYMALLDDGTPFAFGEIIPQENHSVRLARLLVGNAGLRGKGLGSILVQLLLEEVKTDFKLSIVDLFVMEGNTAAIRCYEKNGFAFIPEETQVLQLENGPLQVYKMRTQLPLPG